MVMSNLDRERERRRAGRVLIRIPIHVRATDWDGVPLEQQAETVVVSRCGALLQTTWPLRSGSIIEVENHLSKLAEKFRVVWSSGQQPAGRYNIGVERVAGGDDFWGVRFPPDPSVA